MSAIIYTKINDCQDCYKCVRRCPVKAISMVDNHASIDLERCIYCGDCIAVCPVGAQRYRNDEDRVKDLLSSNKKVILAVAPAFIGEYNLNPLALISAAEELGFYGVSETALGAQLVTYFQRELLKKTDKAVLSTACPTFVHLVLKYFPHLKDNLSPLLTPLLSQCVMLRKIYGQDIAIVFVGPCLGKKVESDIHPELLDVSLTFDEFNHILEEVNIDMKNIPQTKYKDKHFIPIQSNGGAIYPLDGGMVETIKELNPLSVSDTAFFNYAGTNAIRPMLEAEDLQEKQNLFCEFLACEGGCINGSGVFDEQPLITKKMRISEYFKTLTSYPEADFINDYAPKTIETDYDFTKPVKIKEFSIQEKEKIWFKLGKYTKEDFIDCGACGYDTCDKFAIACLEDRAELEMCAPCMRKRAQDKIKAFMKATPLALCVVDTSFKIIECNYKFIELSIDIDIDITDEITQRVIDVKIDNFFPLKEHIESTFRSKEHKSVLIHKDGKIFDVMIFIFEKDALAGLIIQDITKPSMKRDIVISKAQKVIKNNLKSVQKIAFLLGETAAETEITLNEIVDAYSAKEDK